MQKSSIVVAQLGFKYAFTFIIVRFWRVQDEMYHFKSLSICILLRSWKYSILKSFRLHNFPGSVSSFWSSSYDIKCVTRLELCIFHKMLVKVLLETMNYDFNSFMTEVPMIQKPVHWFAIQINGLVSIW